VGTFRVAVSKQYLSFSAAHFLTFRGHLCESLHGHNYRIGITVEGPIDPECSFVVDFAVLKRVLRVYIEKLDHRVLLPSENPKLAVLEVDGSIQVDYFGIATYRFPARDCVLLPITNTTAELLAEWLAGQVHRDLRAEGVELSYVALEVEESAGQTATYIDAPA
jgi:6-pyruvoyltetrahydropterin/6-carboxytetrahydropterin synthase